ncbi:MAG: YesL family protein [Agathobacter sp.]
MGIFSVDGGLYKFMRTLTDVFKINMLWLLCSLPLVTLGGATIAAFDVMMKMSDDEEGYVGRQFIASFKKNWKCGIPYGLLLIFCSYIVWLDFSLFEQIEGNPIILLIMGIIAAFVFTISFLYAFALQARYENTLINTLKNSADISMRYILRTLSLILVLAIELVIIFWNPVTFFIGILIGPACIIYTISGYARYFFREIEREPGSLKEPEKKE